MPLAVVFMRKESPKRRNPRLRGEPGMMAKRYLHWVQTPMPAEYSLVDAP